LSATANPKLYLRLSDLKHYEYLIACRAGLSGQSTNWIDSKLLVRNSKPVACSFLEYSLIVTVPDFYSGLPFVLKITASVQGLAHTNAIVFSQAAVW
jgi:hypothetical protein